MADIKRTALFGKLSRIGFSSLEAATVLCKAHGNPYVELVHWLHELLREEGSDVGYIMRHFDLDVLRAITDTKAALGRLPGGAASIIDFSPAVVEAVEQAYLYATLLCGDCRIRTGHLVLAVLKTALLRTELLDISGEFSRIGAEPLSDNLSQIVRGSQEDPPPGMEGAAIVENRAAAGNDAGYTDLARRLARLEKQFKEFADSILRNRFN
jgi:type VI secretion system protein VasG